MLKNQRVEPLSGWWQQMWRPLEIEEPHAPNIKSHWIAPSRKSGLGLGLFTLDFRSIEPTRHKENCYRVGCLQLVMTTSTKWINPHVYTCICSIIFIYLCWSYHMEYTYICVCVHVMLHICICKCVCVTYIYTHTHTYSISIHIAPWNPVFLW